MPCIEKSLKLGTTLARDTGVPSNFRLGWKWLTDKSTRLPYYCIQYGRKKFNSAGPWADIHKTSYKLLMIIIFIQRDYH